MILCRTEHQCFFVLGISRIKRPTRCFSRSIEFGDAVEIHFRYSVLPILHLAFDQMVVARIDVIIERGRKLPHLEGHQESVVDAVFQRVDKTSSPNRRRCRRWLGVLGSPSSRVLRRVQSTPECRTRCLHRSRRHGRIRRLTTKSKKSGGSSRKLPHQLPHFVVTGHKSLEDCEEHAYRSFGTRPFSQIASRIDPHTARHAGKASRNSRNLLIAWSARFFAISQESGYTAARRLSA